MKNDGFDFRGSYSTCVAALIPKKTGDWRKTMSDNQQAKATWGVTERLSSATGIVFASILSFGLFLAFTSGLRPSGNSPSEIASYFSRHLYEFTLYLWLGLVALPLQAWFYATLYGCFKKNDKGSIWPVIGLVSAIICIAVSFVSNLNWGVLALVDDTVGDPVMLKVLWRLYNLSGFASFLVSSIIMAGFGIEMVRIKSGWWVIGIASLVAGAYEAVAWLMLVPTKGAASPLADSTAAVFISWVLLVSLRLAFGPGTKAKE